MKNGFSGIFILVGILIIAAVVGGGYYFYNQNKIKDINSFEECANAGYPVMEIYPEKCRTPDGRVFTKELSAEEKKKLQPPQSTSSVDEMADWKTFKTSIFSFKYPIGYTVTEGVKNLYGIKKDSDPNVPGAGISIDARLIGDNVNFDQAVKATRENIVDAVEENISNGLKISGKLGPGYGEGLDVITGLMRYKQGAIRIDYAGGEVEKYSFLLNQILSTFKFLP